MYNNPINNTDPTGHRVCEDDDCNGGRRPRSTNPNKGHANTNTPGGSNTTPARAKSAQHTGGDDWWKDSSVESGGGSSRSVIRIDLFIAASNILVIGLGDNRGFSSTAKPSQSRAMLEVDLDENGVMVGTRQYVNRSCFVGGGCLGPYYKYNTFTTTQDPETHKLTVKWDLMNGSSGSFASAADTLEGAIDSPHIGGTEGAALASLILRGGSHAPIPTINGEMTLAPVNGGKFIVESMNRDPYPSIGVYQYSGTGTSVLLEHSELAGFLGPVWGLSPFSPRDTVP